MRKSQRRTGHRSLQVGAAVAVAAAAVLAAPALPAWAATFSLSTSQVAVAGGTVLRLHGSGLALADTQAIRFVPTSVVSCPTNYNDAQAGAVDGGYIDAAGGSTSATLATVVTPALVAGTTYKTCLYVNVTTGGAAPDSSADTLTPVNMTAQSATAVRAADRITMTASSGIYTAASYSTEFVSGVSACPATYTTPASGPPAYIVGTTTKNSTTSISVTVPSTLVAGTPYLVCTYAGTTAGTSVLTSRGRSTVAVFDAALPVASLNPTGGSSNTATTVTASLPTTSNLFATTPDVLITQNACATTHPASLGGDYLQGAVTKIANYKVAVTVPSSVKVATGDVTTPWNLCTYADTSSGSALVMTPTIYTVAPVLTVSGAQFAVGSGSAGSTGSGPAQGNSLLTVSGLTGVPTADGAMLSASLGGSPINITGKTATSITGTTTAHAAGAVNLSVTTAAGTKSTTNTPYTYTYGITIAPNTGTSGTTPILDITGAGFGALTFGDGAAALVANTAYVFLTDNAWNAQTFTPTTGISAFATVPVSYCNTVLPISDSEIICTLNLDAKIDSVSTWTPTVTTNNVATGTYTVTVVNARDGLAEDLHNYSIVSSGSTFTVSPY
jgi:hypothetical protein